MEQNASREVQNLSAGQEIPCLPWNIQAVSVFTRTSPHTLLYVRIILTSKPTSSK